MAFRAFDEWQHTAAADPPLAPAPPARASAPLFTPTELSAIALARIDDPLTLRPRNLVRRLARTLFGISSTNPLADPRLEALRRFAILARSSGGKLPQGEIDRFLAAGFTPHAALALSSLSR